MDRAARQVVCGSEPDAIGPFRVVQQTLTRASLLGPFDEYRVFDGTRAQPLRSTSLASFRRQHWADGDLQPGARAIQWVFSASVDAAIDRGVERLFMGFVGAFAADGFAAAHVRMGQPPAQARPATALLGCTHEDVFAIEPSGPLMHRAGVMSQYTVGISNLGLPLLRTSPSEALVWDGARWQSRPEAIRSFYGRDRRVRFASREWALRGWPTRALVYRDPPR